MVNASPSIGQEFYKVASPRILRYRVVGVRKYETGDLYELECQSCTHGFKCLVLAGFDDYGTMQAIHMLNEDEDNPQHFWHGRDTAFYPTQEEALLHRAYKHRSEAKDELEKAEQALERKRTEIQRLNETIEALETKNKKDDQ